MHITILHNCDHAVREDDPGREAREDVVRVAAALADALTRGDVVAEPLAVTGLDFSFVGALERRRPALVVNLCESVNADSRGELMIPCLLDVMGLAYTGSGAVALGLALHKDRAKELLRARGIATPEFVVVERLAEVVGVQLPFPLIVKPVREDASVGIDFDSVVHDREGLARAVGAVLDGFGQPALVERYIAGREIYVPLLGNRPMRHLPPTEILFGEAFVGKPHILSYRAKWAPDCAEYRDSRVVPCGLAGAELRRIVETACAAFAALQCRDYGRVDMRVGEDGTAYVIEVNPNCDIGPDAGYANAARAAGLDYRALAARLVEIALERAHER